MPHSLRAKLSSLRYKGILEDKDYKRLCKALDNEDTNDRAVTLRIINRILDVCESHIDDGCMNCPFNREIHYGDTKIVCANRKEPLDMIRAEIEALPRELPTDARNMVRRTRVLDIIDKYTKGGKK